MNDPQQKTLKSLRAFYSLSDPEGIRTPDRLLRRQMLYPAELRDQLSIKKERQPSCLFFVGVAGFEPTTSCSQSRRDTGLRYTPNGMRIYTKMFLNKHFFLLRRFFFQFRFF